MSMGSVVGSKVGSILSSLFNLDTEFPGGDIAAIWGDSNIITKGTNNSANTNSILEYGVDTDFPTITVDEHIFDTGGATPSDPPVLTTSFGPVPLRSHAASGNAQRFGSEITFAKQLNAIRNTFGYVVTAAYTSAELQTHWLPSATFPTVGPNLYTIEKTRLKAVEATTGRTVRVIYCDLGANDSVSAGPAGNMQTNMGTMVTQMHADFPNAVIIWPLLSAATATANVATVRTKMLAYSATAPSYFFMPNVDYATMPDISHWDNYSCLTIGTQIAEAARETMGISPVAVTGSPDVVGYGVTQFGNGASLTFQPYKGTQDGDIVVLFAHGGGLTASGVPALSDPAGWTKIIDRTTTAGIINASWKVWTRKVPNGEIATDTVANSHDRTSPAATVTFTNAVENMGRMVTIRGPVPATLAVDTSTSDIFNLNNTGPRTLSALTTGANLALILYFVGGMTFTANPTTSAFTNGGLTGLARVTEFSTNMPDGDWGLISVYKGFKATTGSTGTASATFNVNVLAVDGIISFIP